MRHAVVRFTHSLSGSSTYPAIVCRDYADEMSDESALAAAKAELGSDAAVEFFSDQSLRDAHFRSATTLEPKPAPSGSKA